MVKLSLRREDGVRVIYLGLSFGNLRKFAEEPLDTHIRIDGADLAVPGVEIVLFSGPTEADIEQMLREQFGRAFPK